MLRKLGRDKGRGPLVAAVCAALALAGCSAAYVENDTASVLLVVNSVAGGSPVLSDVRGTGGAIVNCQATVSLTARSKNPVVSTSAAEDVRVTRYTLSYHRSDGRNVEGLDVPYTISGNMTLLVPTSADSVEFSLDLVRHQAKLEPPLMNITGLQVVTMFAELTVYGQTVSEKAVTATGGVQITFADYADGTTTCEGS
jgi:hypothetical protein